MASYSHLFYRRRAQTIMTLPAILEADAPTVLDSALCVEHTFIFDAPKSKITFPLHKLICNYSEYNRLFTIRE